MSPIRTFPLLGALALVAGLLAPAAGQDAAPDGAPQEAAPAAKARPKPKPAPKPVAKPAPARAAAPPDAPKPPAAASAWPAGASMVSETYGEWTMTCTRAEATACTLVQSQGDSQTGKRVFAIELRAPRAERAEGLILMPFGLAIEPGVTFKLDEAVLGKGAPYTTCSGEGCLVPISFPTLATDTMKTAKSLVVTGQRPGGAQPMVITVPLSGFATAFERAGALGG